jgi:hypothetical protein
MGMQAGQAATASGSARLPRIYFLRFSFVRSIAPAVGTAIVAVAADLRVPRQSQFLLDLGNQVHSLQDATVGDKCELARLRVVHDVPSWCSSYSISGKADARR